MPSFFKKVGRWVFYFLSTLFLLWLLVHFISDQNFDRSFEKEDVIDNATFPLRHQIEAQGPPVDTSAPPDLPDRAGDPPEARGAFTQAQQVKKADIELGKSEESKEQNEPAEKSSYSRPEKRTLLKDKAENGDSASWLTLQAISWSPDPKKRIAVINNGIIKEGWPVERGRVLSIQKDDVIIESDGKEWRLSFGKR